MLDRFALVARCAGASALVAGLLMVAAPQASAAPPRTEPFRTGASCPCNLPVSFAFTEFSPGNVNEAHGVSAGPTAFGGTSTLAHFAISTTWRDLSPFDVAFVAGGPVTGGGTTAIRFGNGYHDASLSGVTAQHGMLRAVKPDQLPVHFAQAAAADMTFSTQLAALPTSPGDQISVNSSHLTLTASTGQSDHLYVWDLAPGQLNGITAINVSGVRAGGIVVVNVTDPGALSLTVSSVTLDGMSAGTTKAPGPALAGATLFNFPSATSLTLTGDWAGAIFAPGAATTFNHGHLWGSIDAADLTGTNESTYGPLLTKFCVPNTGTGTSPGTQLPEGRPVEMVGAGAVLFGGFALMRRRRRHALAS